MVWVKKLGTKTLAKKNYFVGFNEESKGYRAY
jgi:hypothetical protein